MKNLKEQKPNVENVQAVDVELNEEQLDVVSGGFDDVGPSRNKYSVVAPLPTITVKEVK